MKILYYEDDKGRIVKPALHIGRLLDVQKSGIELFPRPFISYQHSLINSWTVPAEGGFKLCDKTRTEHVDRLKAILAKCWQDQQLMQMDGCFQPPFHSKKQLINSIGNKIWLPARYSTLLLFVKMSISMIFGGGWNALVAMVSNPGSVFTPFPCP